VIERDDRVIARQGRNVVAEVLFRTAMTVHEHESRPTSRDLDGQTDAIVCRDAHGRHAHAFLPGGAT
jgi:hypothetical protein